MRKYYKIGGDIQLQVKFIKLNINFNGVAPEGQEDKTINHEQRNDRV